MEIFIGLGILFAMYLGIKFLDGKIKEQNIEPIKKTPGSVLASFDLMLREMHLSSREMNLSKNANLSYQYLVEISELCKVAQLYAIDITVNSLEFRGDFFRKFKEKQSKGFQERYDAYKAEFVGTGQVTSTFMKFMKLEPGPDALILDISYANKWMADVLSSSIKILKQHGFN